MLPLVLAALLPVPIDLDGVTVERARAMRGRLVVASFLVAKPPYALLGRTVTGAADRDDGAERTAVVPGLRLDLDVGKRARVLGVLRVIDHAAYRVNGVRVPAWTEVRVEQAPPRRK